MIGIFDLHNTHVGACRCGYTLGQYRNVLWLSQHAPDKSYAILTLRHFFLPHFPTKFLPDIEQEAMPFRTSWNQSSFGFLPTVKVS